MCSESEVDPTELWMIEHVNNGVFFHQTNSGYSNKKIFLLWFENNFIPNSKQLADDDCPVVLFLDGATSHVSLEVIDMAIENNIILVLFPSHTSTHLQPLDVGVFGGFKKEYRKRLQLIMDGSGYSHISSVVQIYIGFLTWMSIQTRLSKKEIST